MHMEKKEYIIDAKNKRLGRVATEAAALLLGKNTTSFAKNVPAEVLVTITNVKLLDVSEKKNKETFATYSGYPGGLKKETLGHLAERRGYSEVVRRVIGGMLPKNKLHKPRMKNLVVTE